MKHLINDDDDDSRVTNEFAYLTMEKRIVFNALHVQFSLFVHFAVILVHPTKKSYLFFNLIDDVSI